MAPQAQSNSQQILLQAAKQLQDAVKETGSSAGPFAMALLEVIESSSKLQEFDEMAKSAQENEAAGEEAQTWREISLMTLQYCRQGLVEQQRAASMKVCELAAQGASLCTKMEPALVAQPAKTTSPEAFPQPPQPCQSQSQPPAPGLGVPLTPPGVWAMRPPPGLDLPAAYDAEGQKSEHQSDAALLPGFNHAIKPAKVQDESKAGAKAQAQAQASDQAQMTAPWHCEKAHMQPQDFWGCSASNTVISIANLDSYSDDESN